MNRRHFGLAAATLLGITMGGLVASPAPAATEAPEQCTPIPKANVSYVDAMGNVARTWARGRGVVATYDEPDGTVRTATILPPGLNPQHASAKVRAALHLPSDAKAPGAAKLLEHLRATPGAGVEPEVPSLCRTLRRNANSPNWSGRVTTEWGNITQVGGVFYVPTYSAVCAHASAHSTWVGFGGWSSTSRGLIQAGIDTSQSSATAVYPFYEVWPKESEIQVSSPAISSGQRVELLVTYDTYDLKAYFSFYNATTGVSVLYSESNVSAYVDKSSAEWIDERPQNASLQYPVDGQFYYYRKSTTVPWSDESINGGAPVDSSGFAVNMVRPNGTVLGTATIGSSLSTHRWSACA